MVKISDIRDFNKSLKSSTTTGLTAVVAGGTNGIGRGFLTALATNLNAPKIYIIGRKQDVLDAIVLDLQRINPDGQYIPVLTGDLTLLSEMKKAATTIRAQEKAIDLLFMSTGYLTTGTRDESSEGLDKLTSIRHYARALLTLELLPLLNAAPSPRVVSVLAAGLEGNIFPDDLALKEPGHYTFGNAAGAAATYVTLSMEQLHKENPHVSFVHAYPGLVRTGIFSTEHFGGVFKFVVNRLLIPTIGRVLFFSSEEAGERLVYTAFSPSFGTGEGAAAATAGKEVALALGSDGKVGSGVYTVNDKQEAVTNAQVLDKLRSEGLDAKILEHTREEIKRVVK
ncbi:NAD(P)-binding protein [Cryphonectria parasitica EP155]|uniref:NAD(P)-binding protein n=1 Tax=Cryphonectria parasitica (strain ATCC 38755 / EP155) TaxID=660469 RepID=A0A9P4XWZ7_CRYP1|nr:NAD(P)-binding protein [Cryphonectria parasitica EP155]KAF3762443.1 NAD(P)-binding protein [Cryphonectria parasitica EP155]